MEYPNAAETQKTILKPSELQIKNQDALNQRTQLRYERLSYFEREEVFRWLKSNLSAIPMLSKTKRAGLQELSMGDYQTLPALALIRHALNVLKL